MTPVSPISHSWDIFFLKTLNLWKLSDGSTNTKTDGKGQERKETAQKTLFDMFHMLCVTCHMSSVNCHYLPTAIARNPSTANFLTIHSRLVCNDPKATKKRNKSFINWLSWWSLCSKYSQHHKSKMVRARKLKFRENVHLPPCVTYQVSYVTCQVSGVRCHMSHYFSFFFFPEKWWN